MLSSIIGESTQSITLVQMLLCTLTSLLLGVVIAIVYMHRNVYTKNFVVTIVLLPVIVQAVIMLVNGSLGTGIAVMGAFSLIRFRSAPGSAKEISSIFLAMAIGIATGMGYIYYAIGFTIVIGSVIVLLSNVSFGERKNTIKTLKITIPENLDYTEIFDEIFHKYTKKVELETVKTTNLGSLYELQYTIELRDMKEEKTFIDEIRCRNGNLNIICGRLPVNRDEL